MPSIASRSPRRPGASAASRSAAARTATTPGSRRPRGRTPPRRAAPCAAPARQVRVRRTRARTPAAARRPPPGSAASALANGRSWPRKTTSSMSRSLWASASRVSMGAPDCACCRGRASRACRQSDAPRKGRRPGRPPWAGPGRGRFHGGVTISHGGCVPRRPPACSRQPSRGSGSRTPTEARPGVQRRRRAHRHERPGPRVVDRTCASPRSCRPTAASSSAVRAAAR